MHACVNTFFVFSAMLGITSLTDSAGLLTLSVSRLTGSRTGVTGIVAVTLGTGLVALSDNG